MNEFITILRIIQPYVLGVAFIAIYIAEHIIPQRREIIDHRHDVWNVLLGILNLVLAGAGGYYLQQLLGYTEKNNFGLLNYSSGFFWLRTALGFIIIDLFMYWWHRANHEIKFLWRFHIYHHKDTKMNSTTAVRFHSVELLLSYIIKFAIFPLLGLTIASVLLHALVMFPVIVFHHSNVSISEKFDHFLRQLFVTPRMHRIHHSKIVNETNSNYGTVFPYWDSLFHSYISRPAREIEFGV